jgi:deoxyinosine 3'endonuclease (endonuclease V)
VPLAAPVPASGLSGLTRLGGVDVSFAAQDPTRACACLVVCAVPSLEVRCASLRLHPAQAPLPMAFATPTMPLREHGY